MALRAAILVSRASRKLGRSGERFAIRARARNYHADFRSYATRILSVRPASSGFERRVSIVLCLSWRPIPGIFCTENESDHFFRHFLAWCVERQIELNRP